MSNCHWQPSDTALYFFWRKILKGHSDKINSIFSRFSSRTSCFDHKATAQKRAKSVRLACALANVFQSETFYAINSLDLSCQWKHRELLSVPWNRKPGFSACDFSFAYRGLRTQTTSEVSHAWFHHVDCVCDSPHNYWDFNGTLICSWLDSENLRETHKLDCLALDFYGCHWNSNCHLGYLDSWRMASQAVNEVLCA